MATSASSNIANPQLGALITSSAVASIIDSEITNTATPGTFCPRLASPATAPSEADFSQWRPRYHVMSTRGWMNDPCGPAYDTKKKLYSVGFQWNPYHHKWGNMSWGSALSNDLVNWDVSDRPAMEPREEMDPCGVFTGCVVHDREVETAGDEAEAGGDDADLPQLAFYTSAQSFSINYRTPYTRGSERLHMATSVDNGRSWTRSKDNVVLSEPPLELGSTVRGWRDPFVATWGTIDRLVGVSGAKRGLYGIISGSIHERSPTLFLYRLNRQNFRQWDYLGSLVDIPVNFCPSPWSGDFGVNWEVGNFVDLIDSEGVTYSVLIAGAEGIRKHRDIHGKRSDTILEYKNVWISGTLKQGGDGIQMQYAFGGVLDHGCFYAANGFIDPATGNFVTFGWVFEEDLSPELVARQGWSGCLSLPRVLRMDVLKNVNGALKSEISNISCVDSVENEGLYKLKILGMLPDRRLALLRRDELRASTRQDVVWFEEDMRRRWEFKGSFSVDGAPVVGMEIAHSQDFTASSSINFFPAEETLIVDRSRSTTMTAINTAPEKAKHTLFAFADGSTELLDLHVFFDASVLEIFVNSRTAITTRVYPKGGQCFGVRWISRDSTLIGRGDASGATQALEGANRPQGLVDGSFWSLREAVRFSHG